MKHTKKVISAMFAVMLIAGIVCTTVSASANNDYYNMPNEYLANLLGTDTNDISYLKESLGPKFNANVERYLNETRAAPKTFSVGARVSGNEWSAFSNATNTGGIIVTKDQTFSSVRHGHTALCYTNSGNTFDVIEHPGTDSLSLRQAAQVSFRYATTLATFYPKNVTTRQKAQAASYAEANLQGWEYSALAERGSTRKMNCATLVWKAYNAAGVDACASDELSITVIPRYFDNTSYTTRAYANSAYINTAW